MIHAPCGKSGTAALEDFSSETGSKGIKFIGRPVIRDGLLLFDGGEVRCFA